MTILLPEDRSGKEAPPPTTGSTRTNPLDTANDISSSPSLALLSPASWKTLCDGRAFFIARSIVKPQTAYGRLFRKCRQVILGHPLA